MRYGCSSESSGLSFWFHEFEDITDSDGALDVSDKVSFVGLFTGNQGDFDLSDTTSWSCSA